MVTGEDFVWLHMPKTGGAAIRQFLVNCTKDVESVSSSARLPIKTVSMPAHDSLAQRQSLDPNFKYEGKRIICGIRRLPNWLLSNIHYRVSIGQDQNVCRENLLRGEFKQDQDTGWITADQRLSAFELEKVDYWVRQENLTSDLFRAFEGLGIEDLITQMETVPRKNSSKISYIKRLDFWFTRNEIQQLYNFNPIWRDLEKRIYGDLLI